MYQTWLVLPQYEFLVLYAETFRRLRAGRVRGPQIFAQSLREDQRVARGAYLSLHTGEFCLRKNILSWEALAKLRYQGNIL